VEETIKSDNFDNSNRKYVSGSKPKYNQKEKNDQVPVEKGRL
jgi:hypothetical protein